MSLLDEYRVMCMSCNKPITENPLVVPVPARGNRPATEHLFHNSAIECAYAPEVNYILLRREKYRGMQVG